MAGSDKKLSKAGLLEPKPGETATSDLSHNKLRIDVLRWQLAENNMTKPLKLEMSSCCVQGMPCETEVGLCGAIVDQYTTLGQ